MSSEADLTVEELQRLFPIGQAPTALDGMLWLHEQAKEIGSGGFIVEVGTWCGWSAAVMALGGPTVLCIDTFTMSDTYIQEMAAVLRNREAPNLRSGTLDLFARRIADAGLGGRVVAVKAKSVEAAQAMATEVADLVFLDADHTLEAVRADLLAWVPIVKPGGLLCLDNWEILGVQRAVLEARETLLEGWSEPVEGCHQIWWTRKPR